MKCCLQHRVGGSDIGHLFLCLSSREVVFKRWTHSGGAESWGVSRSTNMFGDVNVTSWNLMLPNWHIIGPDLRVCEQMLIVDIVKDP